MFAISSSLLIPGEKVAIGDKTPELFETSNLIQEKFQTKRWTCYFRAHGMWIQVLRASNSQHTPYPLPFLSSCRPRGARWLRLWVPGSAHGAVVAEAMQSMYLIFGKVWQSSRAVFPEWQHSQQVTDHLALPIRQALEGDYQTPLLREASQVVFKDNFFEKLWSYMKNLTHTPIVTSENVLLFLSLLLHSTQIVQKQPWPIHEWVVAAACQ